jgi:hypothetical protein
MPTPAPKAATTTPANAGTEIVMLKVLILAAACLAATGHRARADPSSAAKKELVAKVLKLQQPGIEQMARSWPNSRPRR